MSEHPKNNDLLTPAPAEQDAVALIKKVQQQLAFLEKKIDILISQSEAKPAGERHFSKPFRPFNRYQQRPDRGQSGLSGNRSYYPPRHSERPRSEDNREFGYNKKPFGNSSRESSAGQERHFSGRTGGKRKPFGNRNKPFQHKQRGRV